mgnify:CR=1 FL=1
MPAHPLVGHAFSSWPPRTLLTGPPPSASQVAVIDSALNPNCEGAECNVKREQALILYSDGSDEVTVIQPNEDGSYWRRIVRNKMHRMREQRRVKAAGKWFKEKYGEEKEPTVLSSWGPYTSTVGQVYKKNDLSLPAISTKALDSAIKIKK